MEGGNRAPPIQPCAGVTSARMITPVNSSIDKITLKSHNTAVLTLLWYLQCRLLRSRDCPEWPGWDTAVAANCVAHGGFFCPPNWAITHSLVSSGSLHAANRGLSLVKTMESSRLATDTATLTGSAAVRLANISNEQGNYAIHLTNVAR